MNYNMVSENDEVLGTVSFDKSISNNAFKKGLLRACRKFVKGRKITYVKYDKLQKRDQYLIMDQKGKMICTLKPEKTNWFTKFLDMIS